MPQPDRAASMTPERAVKTLRMIHYARPPSLRNLAITAGLGRSTIYRAIHSGHCSQAVAAAIGEAMKQLAPLIEV